MKKLMTMVAVAAVASLATADLANFLIEGSSLDGVADSGGGTPITIVDSGLVVIGDITGSVSGGQINIGDIGSIWATQDMAIAQPFFGGGFASVSAYQERPFLGGGDFADTPATFLYDSNGGGIQVGDMIGVYSFVIQDNAAVGSPAGPAQVVDLGAVVSNVEVIPEPATIGLMGIAGLGLFIARRKARR